MGPAAVPFGPVALPIVAGTLPPGLAGTLYRNGPGRLVRGGQKAGHWFDGDGAVLAVRFEPTGATATYRYVETAAWQAEEAADRWLFPNYGSVAPGPWLGRFGKPFKNAANTSVLALDDRLLALWEGGRPHGLDLTSLATLGEDDLGGELRAGETFSAHPKRDAASGEIYNFGVLSGARSYLQVFRCDRTGKILRRRAIALGALSLIHDFCLAGPYLVFCIPPVRLDLWPALLNFVSLSEALRWRPEVGGQVWVLDRETLETIAQFEVDPWYQWHFGNGWQEPDGMISLSLVAYPDFATNRHLQEVASGQVQTPAEGRLVQIRLDPQRGRLLERQVLVDRHAEFPTHAATHVGLPHRYTYLSLHGRDWPIAPPNELFGAIGRYDSHTGRLTYGDAGAGRYPSEPIFVADPAASDPEDGWVLTVVYDSGGESRSEANRSEVWVYRSEELESGPVCRLALPGRVNLSFHGTWQADPHS